MEEVIQAPEQKVPQAMERTKMEQVVLLQPMQSIITLELMTTLQSVEHPMLEKVDVP